MESYTSRTCLVESDGLNSDFDYGIENPEITGGVINTIEYVSLLLLCFCFETNSMHEHINLMITFNF